MTVHYQGGMLKDAMVGFTCIQTVFYLLWAVLFGDGLGYAYHRRV